MKHHARKALNRQRSPDLYWRRYRPPFTPMRCDPLSAAERRRVAARLDAYSRVPAYNDTPGYQ